MYASCLTITFIASPFKLCMFNVSGMLNSCIVCGRTKRKGDNVSMFRFPSIKEKRQQWLVALNLSEEDISKHSRVCSKHFLRGSSSTTPSIDIGPRFASPKKRDSDRSKRVEKRNVRSPSFHFTPPSTLLAKRPALESSRDTSVASTSVASNTDDDQSSMCASIGEPLLSDYSIHELPSSCEKHSDSALTARIEFPEAETKCLRCIADADKAPVVSKFRLSQIANDDSLVRFYTGFYSFQLLLCFFEFLGPAVYRLSYWGDSERKSNRKRKRKVLDPLNQFFLTLVRLRLNLRVVDLSCRFGISTGLVYSYFMTWVCFIYKQLNDIDWTPSVEQVAGTLPSKFQEKYPTTYSIIDDTEIFIQVPSDLSAHGAIVNTIILEKF